MWITNHLSTFPDDYCHGKSQKDTLKLIQRTKMNSFIVLDLMGVPEAKLRDQLGKKIMALEFGEGVLIHTDKDPDDIVKHITKELDVKLNWLNLIRESDHWEVLISKEAALETLTIKELIEGDISRLVYFVEYDPKYCIEQIITLNDFCTKYDLNLEKTYEHIKSINNPIPPRFELWKSSSLINYILDNYHEYERNLLDQIREDLDFVLKYYDTPTLKKINNTFSNLHLGLLNHFSAEEYFFINKLTTDNMDAMSQNIIHSFQHEHQEAMQLLGLLKSLTDNFTTFDDSNFLITNLYKELYTLYIDLIYHTYIERNFLMF